MCCWAKVMICFGSTTMSDHASGHALPNGRATAPCRHSYTGLVIKMFYILRKATLADRPAIEQLIVASARGLSRADYSEQQIEGAIKTVFGVDTNLILDGTYFVADNEGELVGCGGWSKRRTLFGGDQYATRDAAELDPKTEPAKIRAFFIHPEHARKGIAR